MEKKSPVQLIFEKTGGWGGRRPGAGRPNRSGLVAHGKRPEVHLKTPLHITLRSKEGLPTLRRKEVLQEFKECIKGARKFGLYVIHFSMQSNHIHVFAEAENNRALALGMRALAGRFARCLRSRLKQAQSKRSKGRGKSNDAKGSVFNGRYHLHILRTPREVRNALEYVLLNLANHQKRIEYMDRFSSAPAFKDWAELLGARFRSLIKADAEFYGEVGKATWKFLDQSTKADWESVLSPPRSWLAKTGWQRAGAQYRT